MRKTHLFISRTCNVCGVLPALTAQTKARNRRKRDDRPPPLEGLALLVRLEEYDQILANTLWRPDRDVRRVGE